MTAQYLLKGLDCVSCASKIESIIGDISQVSTSHIDFATQKLTITSSQLIPIKALESLIKSVEPGIKVVPWKNYTARDIAAIDIAKRKTFKKEWIMIALSIFLSIAGFVVKSFAPVVSLMLLIIAYVIVAFDVIRSAVLRIFSKNPLDETLLMTIATAGAWLLGERLEAVGVMVFYKIGETLQDMAVYRSYGDMRALSSLIADDAHIIVDGHTKTIPIEEIAIGNLLEVRSGERVPVDGTVVMGQGALDTSALTGEALPLAFSPEDSILSGSINLGPLFHMKAEKTVEDSTVSRILKMTQEEEARRATPERFLAKFAYYYTPIVVILAFLVFLLPPLLSLGSFSLWGYRALLLLVISCPCALVLSVPLSYVAGMSRSAKEGFLVKGGTVLESLSKINVLALDKTGTLTEGAFHVDSFVPVSYEKEEDFLFATFLCESKSQHPLAKSIMKSKEARKWAEENKALVNSFYHHEEIPGKGVRLIFDENHYACGSTKFMEELGVDIPASNLTGQIHTVKNGQYLGTAFLFDAVRKEAVDMLNRIKKIGISDVFVLSGDNEEGTQSLKNLPNITTIHPNLMPEDKALIIREKGLKGAKTAYLGDGINDAPAIASADVGIAMGGMDSQVAIDSSDAILASNSLLSLPKAIEVARRTAFVVRLNIAISIIIKILVMSLGIFGLTTMWLAIFADVGVSVLCTIIASSIRFQRISI